MDYQIRPFQAADQPAAKALILAGLAEHFGTLDPARNPDLDNIWEYFVAGGGAFFVAEMAGRLVGTGALGIEKAGIGRIARVSVDQERRGLGLGRTLVKQLLAEARRRQLVAVVVETNHDWYPAIALYQSCGFDEYARDSESIHMKITLAGRKTGAEEKV